MIIMPTTKWSEGSLGCGNRVEGNKFKYTQYYRGTTEFVPTFTYILREDTYRMYT